MGLLTVVDGDPDAQALLRVASDLVDLWNKSPASGDGGYGFKISTDLDLCRKACVVGAGVLSEHFFHPPSAFKRTAAAVVIGRLYPFIELNPDRPTDNERHRWLSRLMVLLIPSLLSTIKTTLTSCERPHSRRDVTLPNFKGWPSVHVKVEFLEWLSSLDSLPDGVGLPREDEESLTRKRLARMTMAASLIIENAYYWGERIPDPTNPNSVQNLCWTCIEKIAGDVDLNYEFYLVE